MDKTTIHKILLILAGYGIIQVLAQDFGIKTGINQRNLVQSIPGQTILFYAGAYFVTEDLQLAGYSTILYFFLKYVYSKGETSPVCFEDMVETEETKKHKRPKQMIDKFISFILNPDNNQYQDHPAS